MKSAIPESFDDLERLLRTATTTQKGVAQALNEVALQMFVAKFGPDVVTAAILCSRDIGVRNEARWRLRIARVAASQGVDYNHKLQKGEMCVGSPCKHGHTMRYVKSRNCVECERKRNREYARRKAASPR